MSELEGERDEHAELALHAGVDHGVVDVADHAEAGLGRGDEDAAERRDRRIVDELEVHLVPSRATARRELDAEVAFAIGANLGGRAAEAGSNARERHFVGLDALQELDEVAPAARATFRRTEALVLEHAASQHELRAGAVAAIREDDYLIGVFWSCTMSHSPSRFSKTSVR